MNSADEEAYRHFKDTLEADLRQNIKPVIISLTMLAEDYKQSSQMIAKSIEEYILHVPADIKILGLYLMDSIMKNLKYTTNYTTIFEKSMVNLFLRVFECVDEQNRKALYKLRQTWNEVFSNRILFEIDVSVKKIDPAWPITASLQQKTQQPQPNDPYIISTKPSPPTSSKSILINQTNIINPANSQSVQQVVQHSPNATKITNGTNSMPTTTSNKSQELNKQQQVAQQRTSPNLMNKEPLVKKQLEFTAKKATEESTDTSTIRDPRLAQRKTKPCTQQAKRDSMDTSPNPTSTSPNQLKKKQTNDNKQCLKRSSPSSSSIQNVHEVKKAKMTPPLNGDKISPNKPLISPSKQNINSKFSTSPPTNKQTQQINKIPKVTLQNNEDDESKKSKLIIQRSKQEGLKQQQTTAQTVTATQKQLNKIEKPSDDVKKQTKTIPSLFDIQLDIPHTASLLKKQPSQSDLKQKQFNKTGPNQQQQSKSKTQQQQQQQQHQSINKQQTVKTIVKKQSNDLKTSSNEAKIIQKKTIKSNDSKKITDDFIFGNDEDVDERFSVRSIETNKTLKTDDLTQQLRKLTDLISTTPTINPTPSITKPATSDLLSILFDSNNKLEPNVLALITAQKTKSSPIAPITPAAVNPIETLANNKQSLNELEKKLIISKQNDQVNNETNTSTNTQELVDMIQTLIKQQQMLLDQQSHKEPSPAVTNQIDELDESQNISNNIEENEEPQDDFEQTDQQQHQQAYYDQIATYNELPPIKPRDKNENQNDSLLIIDGRSYRIQPEVRRLIKVYYHDHELFCDTRTKEVFVDKKRVYKMGEPTKEIMLNGRRVRLMYMGRRIEIWIDGLSYHFRADSPPKQISISSSTTNQIKRYYVTIDSRTMDMFFDNYKVCQISGGQSKQVQLAPNDFEYHEISFVCPPKRIMIDGMPRTMRYDLPVPCIEMESGRFHVIRFSGKPREIYIDEIPYLVPYDKTIRIKLNSRAHELAWGGPGFEVIIDGRPYELQFNKPSREIVIGTRPHFIYICGDAPDVKICGQLPYELLQQKEQEDEMETEQSKIIKSLPSLMQPLQSNFMMSQPMSSNQQPLMIQPNKTPNLDELFQSLLEHKLIKPVPKHKNDRETKQSSPLDSLFKNLLPQQQQQMEEIEKLPDLTNFDVDLLKKTYTGAIQSLYSGHQCATCGNRFNQNETGTNNSRYRKHLDWHFRQNRKEKDEVNKAHSREWYYILQDWIQFEELSEDSANNSQNENDKQTDRNNDDLNSDDIDMNHGMPKNPMNAFGGVTTCPATDDIDDTCYVCLDPFEIFFHEEKDEWHFKDAIRVERRVYHPICFEDAREDQSFNNRSINDESMVTETTTTRVKDEPTVNTSQSSQDQIMMSQTDEQMPESQQPTEMVMSQNERQNNNHLKNEPKTP